jgi:hypothetical protein
MCRKFGTLGLGIALTGLAMLSLCGSALAAGVYTFTYTDEGLNPGWSASGYFSISVADFTAATPSYTLFDVDPDPGVQLPNTDITAAQFTITTPDGSVVLGLSFVDALGANVFDLKNTLPQLVYGDVNYLVNSPAGCNPETNSPPCTVGIQAATFGNSIFDSNASTDIFGTWTTSLTQTPIPAALPLFAGGLGLIGVLARRRKRQAAPAI